MDKFRIYIASFLQAFIFFVIFEISPSHSAAVSFCDGNKLIRKQRGQCSAGIKFGEKLPDCVCIRGMYVAIHKHL